MTTTTSLAASTLAAFFRLAAHDALEGLGAARLAVGLIVTRLAEGDAVVNVKAQFGVVCPGLLVMGYETRATLGKCSCHGQIQLSAKPCFHSDCGPADCRCIEGVVYLAESVGHYARRGLANVA